MQAPIGVAITCPVLVGRASHLDELQACVNTARAGQTQMVLLAGEAGIGKSRLAAEVATFAAEQGFRVLEGRCAEHDATLPYAPLLDLLRSQFVRGPIAGTGADLDPATRELIRLLPGIMPLPPDLSPETSLDPASRQQRLFAALAHHFAALATHQPLLLLFEDLHWSDDSTLEWLRQQVIFHIRAGHSVLLLLTYRGDDANPMLQHWLAHVARERLAREFLLAGLTRDEIGAMLSAIFDLRQPVRAEFLDALYELTSGNPFFIEEVLQALIASGDIFLRASGWDRKPLDQLRIPASIQDAVRRRTERLSPTAQRVATFAAIAGTRFDFGVVQALARLSERALLRAMDELIAAHLVVEESADLFVFRHALTRQAIYANLLARKRRGLHHAIVDILERTHAGALEPWWAELAYHATEAEAWGKALEYARQAADQAWLLHAPRVVVQQVTRALVAARHLDHLAPQPGLYRVRGAAHELLGDFAAARADYEQALHQARLTRERTEEWEALLALGEFYARLDYARAGTYLTQALDLARALGDPLIIARSLNRVGNWHLNTDGPDAAPRFHQDALTLFEAAHDRKGQAQTLDLLGMTYAIIGDPWQSNAYYPRAIALFRELDDQQGLVNSLVIQVLQSGSYWSDTLLPAESDPDEARRAGDIALAIAREIGWLAGESYVLYELALWYGPRGEYARAFEMAQAGLAIATTIEHQQWITGCHATLGALYLDVLAPQLACEHLERAFALAHDTGSRIWMSISAALLANAYMARQEFPQAAAILEGALADETPMRTAGQRMLWCARAELLLAQGMARPALEIIERLITSDPNHSESAVVPRLWKLRGEAMAALRSPLEAAAALEMARHAARQQVMIPLLWRLDAALARLSLAEKHMGDARHASTSAWALVTELATQIPDVALQQRFKDEVARMLPASRSAHDVRSRAPALGSLTRREREVARLVARGRSNSQIAAELVVGRRTVETHISNIFAKLRLTSRAQLIAWAFTHDVMSDSA